jgi:hypothetical protein
VCLLEGVRRDRPFLRRRGVVLRAFCGEEASRALDSVLVSMAEWHQWHQSVAEGNRGALRISLLEEQVLYAGG